MAMAQSFRESGSDEVRDTVVDICSYCATRDKLQPATHFCFDCGVFGRYICGICLQHHNLFTKNHDARYVADQEKIGRYCNAEQNFREKEKYANERASSFETISRKLEIQLDGMTAERDNVTRDKDILAREKINMQKNLCILQAEKSDLKAHNKKAMEDSKRKLERQKDAFESEMRTKNNQMEALRIEKDDLRDRLSKVAGEKLTEKNAVIADLSDPNRAMKLSEKFSQLYDDDDWTDAFQALCDKKIKSKDAIHILLRILRNCYETCETTAQRQLEALTGVLIYPMKTVGEASKDNAGVKGKPRLGSKNAKILIDARRQMWEASVDVVRQGIFEQTKDWMDKEIGPKAFDATKGYIEKCSEICWLLVIHDPPVYIKMDAKNGEKMDRNLYKPYSASGEKIDYLVWPPLFYGRNGGLLSKGVAEPLKTIKKDKK